MDQHSWNVTLSMTVRLILGKPANCTDNRLMDRNTTSYLPDMMPLRLRFSFSAVKMSRDPHILSDFGVGILWSSHNNSLDYSNPPEPNLKGLSTDTSSSLISPNTSRHIVRKCVRNSFPNLLSLSINTSNLEFSDHTSKDLNRIGQRSPLTPSPLHPPTV